MEDVEQRGLATSRFGRLNLQARGYREKVKRVRMNDPQSNGACLVLFEHDMPQNLTREVI